MKIYIGADHNGYYLRETLVAYLKKAGYAVQDVGDEQLDPADDFPVFAKRVVTALLVSDDPGARGILLCGSGQGMCMAANRHKGIRAALGYDLESVRSARNDDDSNVLCLPAHTLEKAQLLSLVETWLQTDFAGAPRFIRRLRELDEL